MAHLSINPPLAESRSGLRAGRAQAGLSIPIDRPRPVSKAPGGRTIGSHGDNGPTAQHLQDTGSASPQQAGRLSGVFSSGQAMTIDRVVPGTRAEFGYYSTSTSDARSTPPTGIAGRNAESAPYAGSQCRLKTVVLIASLPLQARTAPDHWRRPRAEAAQPVHSHSGSCR